MLRQPQARVEAAGGEQRDRAGRGAHGGPVRAADPAQQPTDRDGTAAKSHLVRPLDAGQPGRRGGERGHGPAEAVGETVGVAGDADVGVPPPAR